VLTGAVIGEGAVIGDQAHVRERAQIGAGSVIGRATAVDNDVIIGLRARVQSMVYITAGSLVEDDVFIGPGAVTTNDDTAGRHSGEVPLVGALLRRACRIGGGAVILPGVEVGEEAFVAGGAVVRADVAARTVVAGVPARLLRDVTDEELLENWR
jgi:acetyltransferase-like isoleucine patch superfamily enzyme